MPEGPRRIHFLVEGQTEETVVRDVLEPHLAARGSWVTWSILVTRRPAGQPWNHGGATSWRQIHGDVRRLLGDTSIDILTTMIDYYGLPVEAPGMATRPGISAVTRVTHVEDAIGAAVGSPRFVPHLVLHELEAWVFAAADELADLHGDPGLAAVLRAEVAAAGGAEMVNDGPDTAPSKRLLGHCTRYAKTFDGPMVIADLGLPALRAACPHMDAWMCRLEA